MKTLILSITALLYSAAFMAQPTRVAIIDFENISGIAKYDGLGKAMSSMLISDIEANVSPKRLQLVERAQIQKVLKEQNFQASGSVDKSTAVKAGKILGVTYMLVGDVYILNDQLIINARLANTETGDIVFSKKQEGKTTGWLTLKTAIAKDITASLSIPFDAPSIPDEATSVATISTFGNAVAAKDSGDMEKAETLSETLIEMNPEFDYAKELKSEIDEIKKEIAKMNEKIDDALDNPEEIALELIAQNSEIQKAIHYLDMANSKSDFYSEFGDTKKLFIYFQKARAHYRLGDFKKSMEYYDSCLILDKNFIAAHFNKFNLMMGGNFGPKPSGTEILIPDKDYSQEISKHFHAITQYNKSRIKEFNTSIYRDTYLNDQGTCSNNPQSKDCNFFNYAIELPHKNGATVFDDLMRDRSIYNLFEHISEPTYDYARYLISTQQKENAIKILENSINQQFEFLRAIKSQSQYAYSDRNFDLSQPSSAVSTAGDFQKYTYLITEFYDVLINKNSISSLTFFDNILLLSNLYLQNNDFDLGFNLINDFRTILEKNFLDSQQKEHLIPYFKFLITQAMLCEKMGRLSEPAILKSEELFNIIKQEYPKYIDSKEISFSEYYLEQIAKIDLKVTNDMKYSFLELSENNKSIINLANNIYPSVENIVKYYNHDLANKTILVHAYIDSTIQMKEYSDDFYLNFVCADGYSSKTLTFNANKHTHNHACIALNSNNNSHKRISLILTLNEYGKPNLIHFELGWKSYEDLDFSGKPLFVHTENGILKSSELKNKLESTISQLNNEDTYYEDLMKCFGILTFEKSYDLIKNDTHLLNNLAWAIADSKNATKSDIDMAVKMAERANYIMFETDHNILDTYAFTLLKSGNKNKSIEILTQAISLATSLGDSSSADKYKQRLAKY